MTKIIFTDVDDTITESTKPITDETASVLNSILDRGIKLVFISGSTVDQIYNQISHKLNSHHTLIGTSGSHCVEVEYENGKRVIHPVFWEGLSVEEIEEITDAINDLVYRYNIKPMTTRADQIQDRASQVTFSALGRNAPSQDKKAFDPNGTKRAVWAQELKEKLGDRFSYNIGGSTSIDVTIKGIDKGVGIARYLEVVGEDQKNCVFFGDKLDKGGNDYPARNVLNCCVPINNPNHFLEVVKDIG